MTETTPSPLNNVITIDDERIKSHLERVVRGTVEETLNALPIDHDVIIVEAQNAKAFTGKISISAGVALLLF